MNREDRHRFVKAIGSEHLSAATRRQTQLTKPAGSLGALESVAIRLCGMQGREQPNLDRVHIAVFAADHGVAVEGVSAYPQSVTVEMLRNFAHGGAAINVLAETLGATLEVVNVGTILDPGPLPGVRDRRVGPGTANIRLAAAMTATQLDDALTAGAEAVERVAGQTDIFIGGDMGIANTTSATAVACAITEHPAVALVGPGTGLNEAGLRHKTLIIDAALMRHRVARDDALSALRCLGGFEIAALCGAYLRCAQLGLPVLIDGYIASVAALCAQRLNPNVTTWFFYGHLSAEPGHRRVLEALRGEPLLQLGMRLGEGSGAAVAVPLLRLACALHNRMATFAEAGVSRG